MVLATPIPPTTSATTASPRNSAEKVLSVARLAASASEGRVTITCPGCSGWMVSGRTARTASSEASSACR